MIKSVSQLGVEGVSASADPDDIRRALWKQAIEENRDFWGRPKIMLPDGSREVGYRRASAYGAPLEDASALERHKMRQVARGVARRPAIALAVTRAEVGLEDPDPKAVKAAKEELDELCKQAQEAVGASDAAAIGTSLHAVCERIDLGKDPGFVPDQWRADIEAYRQLTVGFEPLGVERFVVQDEHQVAGTLDRAVRVLRPLMAPDGTIIEPGSVMIGDVKTSQSMDFAAAKFGIQCWVYATGIPYNPVDKVRIEWGHEPPRLDWAVIFHVPSGKGRAGLYWVDLRRAADAAHDVREVYLWRNRYGKRLITEGALGEDFMQTCAEARTLAELTAAYKRAVALGAWNDVLRARFTRRRVELEAVS